MISHMCVCLFIGWKAPCATLFTNDGNNYCIATFIIIFSCSYIAKTHNSESSGCYRPSTFLLASYILIQKIDATPFLSTSQ